MRKQYTTRASLPTLFRGLCKPRCQPNEFVDVEVCQSPTENHASGETSAASLVCNTSSEGSYRQLKKVVADEVAVVQFVIIP